MGKIALKLRRSLLFVGTVVQPSFIDRVFWGACTSWRLNTDPVAALLACCPVLLACCPCGIRQPSTTVDKHVCSKCREFKHACACQRDRLISPRWAASILGSVPANAGSFLDLFKQTSRVCRSLFLAHSARQRREQ
jgi:hypothetical protein